MMTILLMTLTGSSNRLHVLTKKRGMCSSCPHHANTSISETCTWFYSSLQLVHRSSFFLRVLPLVDQYGVPNELWGREYTL